MSRHYEWIDENETRDASCSIIDFFTCRFGLRYYASSCSGMSLPAYTHSIRTNATASKVTFILFYYILFLDGILRKLGCL